MGGIILRLIRMFVSFTDNHAHYVEPTSLKRCVFLPKLQSTSLLYRKRSILKKSDVQRLYREHEKRPLAIEFRLAVSSRDQHRYYPDGDPDRE